MGLDWGTLGGLGHHPLGPIDRPQQAGCFTYHLDTWGCTDTTPTLHPILAR